MSIKSSGWTARCIAALALFSLVALAMAQPAGPAASQQVTLSLDRDLVTFVKVAVWAGGIFLAVFAVLAVGFFGFDVRTARKSLLEASDDLRTRMEGIRKDHQSLLELKERLSKLGAELIEQIETNTPSSLPPEPPKQRADDPKESPSTRSASPDDLRALLRTLMAASEFEWATAGTLAKRTNLSREDVINLAGTDPLVQRGVGRNGDVLFRLKRFNNLLTASPIDIPAEEWENVLREHAAAGKPPQPMGGKGSPDRLF